MLNHCKALIHSLAIYTGASLQQANDTAISDADDIFQGKTFSARNKEREAEFKLQAAIISRLDVLIKVSARRR